MDLGKLVLEVADFQARCFAGFQRLVEPLSAKMPQFKTVNTVLSNLKTGLTGT